jgi:predicted component of type VI protein secretion system
MSAQLNAGGALATAEHTLLDQIVEQSKVAKSSTEHARARDIIAELAQQVMAGTVVVSDNLAATIDARVAELDRLISAQLSAIMHAPEFQKLESSWTGLHYLVRNSATGTNLKIKMLNATKKELVKDFQGALEFDQSAMFRKVYEEEFGTFGGAPFGALIGDFEITRQPEDMYFIEQMSHVAAAAHAPFVSAASPELFGLETYADLGKPRDLSKVFDTVEYAKWKSFRESEDSRYVGLTLPRFLGRLPFNPADGATVEGFNYVEDVDGTDHQKYLWCNAAYAFGVRLTRAFEDFGRRRPGGRPADPHLQDRRRRSRAEMPDRNRHYRPPRERAERPWLHLAGALQEYRLRGLLRRAVCAESAQVQHRRCKRQRRAVGPAAVHLRRVAHRPLHEGHDARQDRQLRCRFERRGLPEPLADPVRAVGR